MNYSEKITKTYQTLNELITALSQEKSTEYDNIIRSIELPISAFEKYCSWSNESYTRNCIVENERFELILLCWEQGQMTPIHDHGGEECWVRIIEGEFKETIYKEEAGALNVVKSSISKTNEITYMIDFMGFHSLENISNKKSMSLHLYAKPIRKCTVFDEDSKGFINKEMSYHTTASTRIKKLN